MPPVDRYHYQQQLKSPPSVQKMEFREARPMRPSGSLCHPVQAESLPQTHTRRSEIPAVLFLVEDGRKIGHHACLHKAKDAYELPLGDPNVAPRISFCPRSAAAIAVPLMW